MYPIYANGGVKGVGALQQKDLIGAALYRLFGTTYEDAPYYDENEYQYRCRLTGYNQILTGIFSPVDSNTCSVDGK